MRLLLCYDLYLIWTELFIMKLQEVQHLFLLTGLSFIFYYLFCLLKHYNLLFQFILDFFIYNHYSIVNKIQEEKVHKSLKLCFKKYKYLKNQFKVYFDFFYYKCKGNVMHYKSINTFYISVILYLEYMYKIRIGIYLITVKLD